MGGFLLRKFIYTLVVMWLTSVVVFLALRITPGDTTNFIVNPVQSAERRAEVRHELGLDQPLTTQYADFGRRLLTLDLGLSAVTGRPITTTIADGLPYTMLLALTAGLVAYGLGIPLGVIAALRRNRWVDQLATGIAVFGMGIPNFVLAILLILVFPLWLGWFEVSGATKFAHLVLPTVVLAVEPLAVTIRLMRSAVLEQLSQDYIKTLTAKGLPHWRVIWQHVLKNSMGPMISLGAVQLRSLLGYTLIVEVIFRWPGLGSQLVYAVLKRDYMLAQTLALMLTLIVILFNFLADVGYAFADPRVRAAGVKT